MTEDLDKLPSAVSGDEQLLAWLEGPPKHMMHLNLSTVQY